MSATHPEELRARITLRALPGISEAKRGALLSEHGSAAAVLSGGAALLGGVAASALVDGQVSERATAAFAGLATCGGCIVIPGDPEFPALPEPLAVPSMLFARGRLELLKRPAIAIVGTRTPTEYGLDVAADLASGLARAGVAVISGLARGIDGAAHGAALDAGGATIGVLGCGIDVIYPREHDELQESIAARGLLLSEVLPGEPPLRHQFVKRNRLIAGLSCATVVVEGRRDSGSLSTARCALDANCDVFAVPGPVGRATSEAPLRLLRDGAQICTCVDDLLTAVARAWRGPWPAARRQTRRESTLSMFDTAAREPSEPQDAARGAAEGAAAARPPGASPAAAGRSAVLRDTVLAALGPEARHIDDVITRAGAASTRTLAVLLELEIDGRVEQLPGMRFRRRQQAQSISGGNRSGAHG